MKILDMNIPPWTIRDEHACNQTALVFNRGFIPINDKHYCAMAH